MAPERGISRCVAFSVPHAVIEQPSADISVVIPVYNHEQFVGNAIASVLSQTVRPREVICIDDGSTDSSAHVVQALAKRHPLIRFWSRPNQGAHSTINEGIRAATGQYVSILNSDDVYHHGRLARCLAVFEADPNVSVVASGISFIDESGRKTSNRWYEKACDYYKEVADLGLALVNGNFLMTTSNIVARRSVFAEIGLFDNLRYSHDLDFFLRLVSHGKKLALVPRALLRYRVHSRNTISESHDRVRLEWAVVAAFFAQRIASANGSSRHGPDYLSRLLRMMDRHQLTQLVTLCLLQIQGKDCTALTPGTCLADESFRSALADLRQ
jgi:glycosyltransferase involved in cell wall biosynthesis